jgi:hypothetical protein
MLEFGMIQSAMPNVGILSKLIAAVPHATYVSFHVLLQILHAPHRCHSPFYVTVTADIFETLLRSLLSIAKAIYSRANKRECRTPWCYTMVFEKSRGITF